MNLAVCKQCGAILHSKHRHDFVSCSCPNGTFVDGGNDYHRGGGKSLAMILYPKSLTEAHELSDAIRNAN
jgi:hypothetical protein